MRQDYYRLIILRKNPLKIVLTKLFRTSSFDTKKLSIIILVVTITIIVDSTTGSVADFIPEQLSSSSGIGAFIGIVILSAIAQYFILSYVKENNRTTRKTILHIHSAQTIVSLAQYVLIGILVVVILQILVAREYNLVTLYASYAISYGLWIVMFALLARAFFSWYKSSDKNMMVLILTMAMIAYVINGITAMVYYLISYPLFVLGYFTPSGGVDAMTNILIFSLAGIFTGIIFGAAFLSVARTFQKDKPLRNLMMLAAYGFLLFYVAGSATAAQAAYPPYGLASVSFTGLSCYLIYTGLYSSAVIVSQDSALRISIRRSVTEQSKLLDSLGTAQMEQES